MFKKGSLTINYQLSAIILGIAILIGAVVLWLIKPDSKILQAHQQVASLAEEIRSFYRRKPDAWGLNTTTAIENRLVNPNMIHGHTLRNALDKEVLLGSDILGNTVMPGNRNAVIVYKHLNQTECEKLATMPFDNKMQLSVNSISIVNSQEHKFTWGNENALPISYENAKKLCQKNNDILWDIYL